MTRVSLRMPLSSVRHVSTFSHPCAQVSGFPTLKLVTADGSIVDYAGDRSEEDLIKFINSNADSSATAASGTDEL